MNLNQIKYFHAVCTYKTVSAAAQYLHISQPSLSNAIRELESDFGVILFRRHHHGMALTPEGEALFNMSEELLKHAEKVEHIMNNLGSERKTLRLGVPPMIGSLILPHIYSSFAGEHPEIHLEITEGGRDELLSKLYGDFLDMVFLPHNTGFAPELSALNITQLEIVCCVSKNNPLSAAQRISATELAGAPLVLFKDSFFQTGEIKKWLAASGVCPNILLQTEQLSTVQTMISSTAASGFMFRPLAQTYPDFALISTTPPLYVNVSLVWKKDAYRFSSMCKFIDYISSSDLFKDAVKCP